MELQDKDLRSVQETRNLLREAREASKKLARMEQSQIDRIVASVSSASIANAERLAKLAQQETGFGIWQDKVIKNLFAAKTVYDAIKDQRTIGILREDRIQQVWDVGVPVGVVAALVPSTNPTSTVIYKAMISLKGGNAVVFSPHPSAKDCILETVRVVAEAAEAAGCPKGAVSAISIPTMEATSELMKSEDTALILATGGGAMVKAAYSSGTPAIGVGAGNGPAFIDRSADLPMAVKRILDSKAFDNGTICASEQSIIIEQAMEAAVSEELRRQGAFLLNEAQSEQLGRFILRANGTMNPKIVGKSCRQIAEYAGLNGIPDSARVLVAKADRVGADAPYSREKLAPILGLFVEPDVDQVLEKSIEILLMEGAGHTFCMHAEDEALVRRFALRIPASRFLVNTAGSLGGIGATTRLFPALTLGCGAVGGSSTSNNIGPMDVINIRRVGFGYRELSQLRESGDRVLREHTGSGKPLDYACRNLDGDRSLAHTGCDLDGGGWRGYPGAEGFGDSNMPGQELVDEIVERILKELSPRL